MRERCLRLRNKCGRPTSVECNAGRCEAFRVEPHDLPNDAMVRRPPLMDARMQRSHRLPLQVRRRRAQRPASLAELCFVFREANPQTLQRASAESLRLEPKWLQLRSSVCVYTHIHT